MIYVMMDEREEYDENPQNIVAVLQGPVIDLDKLKVMFVKALTVPADFTTLNFARWLVYEQGFTWVEHKLFEG